MIVLRLPSASTTRGPAEQPEGRGYNIPLSLESLAVMSAALTVSPTPQIGEARNHCDNTR
jgi:hypothetical protein